MNNLRKLAAPDQDFEQSFFQLAYDKLQSKLYNLLPFLVGFEVVKKTDDGTRAVGIFGFKSDNGQILFVPSFFINGKVKDLDILYSKNNNQFYPLNEDFAELFLKDDVTGLGTASNEKRQELIRSSPSKSYRDLVVPPLTGRTVMASEIPEYDPNAFNKAGITPLSMQDFLTVKIKEAHTPLVQFVSEGDATIKKAFWGLLEKDADFTEAVLRFYSEEEVAKACVIKEAAKKAPKVVINGETINDHRTKEEKSKIGLFKYNEKFSNPTISGFYRYITEVGTLRYGLVLLRPLQFFNGFSTDDTIVVDLDAPKKGQSYIVNSGNVFVKDQISVQDLSEAFTIMEDPAESQPSYDSCILVNEHLQATQSFRILENFKDDFGVRRIKVEPEWFYDPCSGPCSPNRSKSSVDTTPRQVTLVFTKKPGEKLEYKGNMVYIPKGFKILKINTNTYVSNYVDPSLPKKARDQKKLEITQEESRLQQGKPGNIGCLTGAMSEHNVLPFTIHSNGSEYFASIPGVKRTYASPLKAKIGMVLDYGLDQEDAAELLNTVKVGQTIEGTIKLGILGEFQHTLQDEQPYTNELGQDTYQGIPREQVAPREGSYQNDPTKLGLGTMPQIEGIDAQVHDATNMAGAGQKEIFDAQAIASLAKYTDPTSKVTSYIPNFVTSLDKLGRILFMIYWDTAKFQEMYGRDELPELIELIKNVFKNMGDLIIFMKRKVPDLSINNNEQSIDQV